MYVSEVQITPIKPKEGLVGFASCVIDDKLYLGSLGVHKRLDGSGYRITYPSRAIAQKQMHYFHPIRKDVHEKIETAVTERCEALFERSDETSDDRYSKNLDTHS